MTSDLESIAQRTRTYAEHQSMEGGLPLALGGVIVLLILPLVLWTGPYLGTPEEPLLKGLLIALPLIWLMGKEGLRRSLYGDCGRVVLRVDHTRERQTWLAIWTLGFCFLALQGVFLAASPLLPASQEGATRLSLGLRMAAPLMLFLPIPWYLKGRSEAWIYAMLAFPSFLAAPSFPSPLGMVVALLASFWLLLVPIWGCIALISGIRRHRAYRSLLHALQP